MARKEITFDRFVRLLCAVIGLILSYMLLRKLSDVLIPFLVAWLVAYMLYPIVCFFQYRCKLKNRVLSIIVTLLAVFGVIGGTCYLIIPPVANEFGRCKDLVLNYFATDQTVGIISEEIKEFLISHVDIEKIVSALSVSDVSAFIEQGVSPILQLMYSSVNALIGFVASLISLLYIFFILMDYENLSKGILHMIPPAKRKLVSGVLKDVETGMKSYFRGQSVVAFIVGILFAIGFLIIGFPLAIPLGLFIGFLNLVPYLQIIGLIPTIVLSMLKAYDTGESFWIVLLGALLVFAVVQTLQDTVIVPKVMGHVTGLHAAIILFSLSVWGALLGFIGLIIALPLTTLMISYYKRYVLEEDKTESV